MQPVGPVQPEFHRVGHQPKSGPVGGAGNIAFRIFAGQRLDPVEIGGPIVQRARLVRCGGADLRHPCARMEIIVGHFRAYFLQRAFDPDLPAQAFPVKQQGSVRVFADFLTFATVGIGIEHEPVGIVALQKDHPDRWAAFACRGGQRHGVGIVRFGIDRFRHPVVEQRQRIALRQGAGVIWNRVG